MIAEIPVRNGGNRLDTQNTAPDSSGYDSSRGHYHNEGGGRRGK